MPVSHWFRAGLQAWVRETLLSPKAEISALVSQNVVRDWIDSHGAGTEDYGSHLWLLVMLELWMQQCVKNSASETEVLVTP